MISRGVCRAIAGLALVAAVTACDDNPLAENREDAAYFRLNPSNAAVNVGGETRVIANVLNRYGAALVVNITATECDSKVTVERDPIRSDYEYPERFIITGVSHGESCVVVSGGGITDTIKLRVVPATIDVTATDTLVPSGQNVSLSVLYQAVSGGPASGVEFDTMRTRFTVRTAAKGVIDRSGNFSGQEPGQTWVVATFTDMGVVRTDSISLTVVPGPFTGTVAQAAYGGGQALVFTAGGVPFDANTEVRFTNPDLSWVHLRPNTATTARALLPFNLPAGTTINYQIVNMGPSEIATVGSFVTTAATPATDSYGGATGSIATAPVLTPNTDVFGTIGGDGEEVWFTFTATAASHTLTVWWDDGSDIDAYITNAAGTTALLARETLANPETGSVTLTAGTHRVLLYMYEAAGPGNRTFKIRLTR